MKREDARNYVGKELKVSDLLLFMDDIDVYDDVTEDLSIAFCNPFDDEDVHEWSEYLTEEGMKKFDEVLDYPMEIHPTDYGYDMPCAIIKVDDEDGKWEKKLEKAIEFFHACAGYIACDEYDEYFLF